MKRFQGLLNRSKSLSQGRRSLNNNDSAHPVDSPEASAPRAIRLFCESGSANNGGEEVLHLPVIVEAAESSPAAAASAALQIRKFLTREWQSKPHVQYNAIMLIRILSDNPGATFTRNFDKPFITAVKDTLRNSKDPGTSQILRETLDYIEAEKQYDEGAASLIHMWRKEKGYQAAINQYRRPPVQPNQQVFQQPGYGQDALYPQQQYQERGRSGRAQLPPPGELASRIEESRNTAKILLQLIQSTPPDEVVDNELLREFSERCQAAGRSMQKYINCDSPPPDYDTMQTLIETNEQLSLAASRYQRAILAARRAMEASHSPGAEATYSGSNDYRGHSSGVNAPNFQTATSFLPVSQSQDYSRISPVDSFRNASPHQASRAASPPQIPTTRINGYEGHGSYTPPPDRPSYQSYHPNGYYPQTSQGGHTSLFAAVDQPTNPFADPHDPSSTPSFQSNGLHGLGVATNGGHFRPAPSVPQHIPPPRTIPEPSQTFSIEPEPSFAPSPQPSAVAAYLPTPPSFARHTTSELENAYAEVPTTTTTAAAAAAAAPFTNGALSPVSSTGFPSPNLTRSHPVTGHTTSSPSPRLLPDSDSGYTVSPQASPPRPSAAQVVRSPATHPHDHAAEMDGHGSGGIGNAGVSAPQPPQQPPRDRDTLPSRRDTVSSFGTEAATSPEFGYMVSPIEGRDGGRRMSEQRRDPRVDVPGTGGLRGFVGQ